MRYYRRTPKTIVQNQLFKYLLLILFLIAGHSFSRPLVLKGTVDPADPSENGIESQANLRGSIQDESGNALPGASIVIIGTEKGINANEKGEYILDKLSSGKYRVQASLMGYTTQVIEVETNPGQNELNFVLQEGTVRLDPVIVVAQKREQQILDVPKSISVVGEQLIQQNNIVELSHLSDFVPGLFIVEQGANRPTFAIRGLTSEEVSPSAQPRVSTYFNNVPINRASGASMALFDMERVEVLKGPQNSLFGRGSQIGVIHFISKRPTNNTQGYLTAGMGNYGQKEIRAAINLPLIKNKLFVRASGLYDHRDGYVDNTFGGTLNGKNTTAGRLSLRYLPGENQQLDLVLNYQNDDTPGIAFMSGQFPNTDGVTNVFSYRASLEQGENLNTGKDLFDAILNYRLWINENTFLSSITSFRKVSSGARWDGEGTAAPAIDMWEDAGSKQFYQEFRYNYSVGSRLIGSAGLSYWHETADQTYWFSPNEQSMALLFLSPEYLVMPDGQPVLIPALPNDPNLGPLAGMPLPAIHEENSQSKAVNQAVEVFADATYEMTDKLFISAGARMAWEYFDLTNKAEFSGGEASTLGMLTGNYPNAFFMVSDKKSIDHKNLSFNLQTGLQYKFDEKTNLYANYSNGRRPYVLQFTSSGTPEVISEEWLDNVEGGVKSNIRDRVYIDAVAFFQKYRNFQTRAWIADPGTGEFNYKSIDGGSATAMGTEISVMVSVLKGLDLLTNYALLNATFDDTDQNGNEQEYAGNTFRLSPKHSLMVGIHAKVKISSKIQAFVSPTYSHKTQYYFEDANTTGLEQPAYGLLNLNMGFEMSKPDIMLSFFGTNLLNAEYLISAGNTGSLFGVPTFVPGPPFMYGTKLTWRFGAFIKE